MGTMASMAIFVCSLFLFVFGVGENNANSAASEVRRCTPNTAQGRKSIYAASFVVWHPHLAASSVVIAPISVF